MKKKFTDYGKLSAGGEAFDFARERHEDLLREAEESRVPTPTARPAPSRKNRSRLTAFRQLLAQLM
jgi:hypothetical protein